MKYFILIIAAIAGITYFSFKFIKSMTAAQPSDTTVTVDSLQTPAATAPAPIDATNTANPQQQLQPAPWGKPIPLNDIVSFAETLQGVPYLYASADPAKGFDCSGFITYVFNHFGLQVPRSSIEFTNKGIEVPVQQSKRGDLILFTGTDSLSTTVGHMGIVTGNTDSLRFIHSSSGKANGVTITALNTYYLTRFVKVIAIDKGL